MVLILYLAIDNHLSIFCHKPLQTLAGVKLLPCSIDQTITVVAEGDSISNWKIVVQGMPLKNVVNTYL